MMKPISIHRYELVSRYALNARSEKTVHSGALIRVGEEPFGYGCIHPWTELGDAGLDETLELLKQGKCSPLIEQALHCAELDASARKQGVHLFENLDIPLSHATLPLDEKAFEQAAAVGFDTVKVKVGRNLKEEAKMISELALRFSHMKWRFDFNHVCSMKEAEQFLNGLSDDLLGKIDFMEDAWSPEEEPVASIRGVSFAVDRDVCENDHPCPVVVLKPATQSIDPIVEKAVNQGKKFMVTSYMDHPFGQCYAAWSAGMAAFKYPGFIELCGLVTHGLFQPNAFSELLGDPTPVFVPPMGTGFGFDDLLEELLWTPIN